MIGAAGDARCFSDSIVKQRIIDERHCEERSDEAIQRSLSVFVVIAIHTLPRSRDTLCPSFAKFIRPKKIEGARDPQERVRRDPQERARGRPGARCTRGLVCKGSKQKRTRAYRFSGNTPAFPAQWF
jgi:hypothetical protein